MLVNGEALRRLLIDDDLITIIDSEKNLSFDFFLVWSQIDTYFMYQIFTCEVNSAWLWY